MERRREIVLDSSVVVKWFSKEPKSDEALELMDPHLQGTAELVASEILFCEVGNALRYKRGYSIEKLKVALSDLLHLQMKVAHTTEDLMLRTAEIAYDGKVTIYDALPAAIAEHRKTICITADEETQYKKLQAKGYPVQLL